MSFFKSSDLIARRLFLCIIALAAFWLAGCSKQELSTANFETDKPYIQLGDLKLIPWKIPEDVIEPVHVTNIKIEKKASNIYVFSGEAINTSEQTAFALDIVLQFYDKNKKGISSVAEIADPYEVPAGEKARYVVQYHIDAHEGIPVYFDIHAIASRFE